MKSKEEIEQLAIERYGTDGGKIYYKTFIDGYIQCQEDTNQLSEWQLCPKCLGEGHVENIGTSSSVYRICPVCNGNKTLIKPYINK